MQHPNPLPTSAPKKPYAPPVVRREAKLALVTAGSFDLFLPG